MLAHIYFWLGVFVAILLGLPMAIGVWSAAEERALDVTYVAFGAMAALILVLFVALLLRSAILKRLRVQADVGLVNVAETAAKTIVATSKGETEQAAKSASEFARLALAWYSWISFYRWVIGTGAALLVVATGIAGTTLLLDQNRRISEQTRELIEQNQGLVRAVQPYGDIVGQNHRDWVKIAVRNAGVGPLRIMRLRFKGGRCTSEQDRIRRCLVVPTGNVPFENYAPNRDNWVIPAGEELVLLHFKYDYEKPLTGCFMPSLKRQLKGLIISLEYQDLYGRESSIGGDEYKDEEDFSEFFGCLADEPYPGAYVWSKGDARLRRTGISNDGCFEPTPASGC